MTHLTTIETELLVLEAQAGNPDALTNLAQRYNTTLSRRAVALTNNPDAAADITQDTWLAIAKGIRGLRDPARFHAWAASILANHARDWIKSQSTSRARADHNHNLAQPEHAPTTEAANESTNDSVRDAIITLEPKLRDIVILIYMDRCTIDQAAAALAIPVGTAKSRLRKARERLRARIESNERT